ncbi:MAG: hypothetical protein NXI31_13805 [bacterium]|nr:hypothetical protein [bacterium]
MDLSERVLHEGLEIDLRFRDRKPDFGDLFTICGFENENRPPKTRMFANLGDLGFEQVDDYFAIRADSDVGDAELVWLFPLRDGVEDDHPIGPIGSIRLSFRVLWHPPNCVAKFIEVARTMVEHLPVDAWYRARDRVFDAESLADQLSTDAAIIQSYWDSRGVACGSKEALTISW